MRFRCNEGFGRGQLLSEFFSGTLYSVSADFRPLYCCQLDFDVVSHAWPALHWPVVSWISFRARPLQAYQFIHYRDVCTHGPMSLYEGCCRRSFSLDGTCSDDSHGWPTDTWAYNNWTTVYNHSLHTPMTICQCQRKPCCWSILGVIFRICDERLTCRLRLMSCLRLLPISIYHRTLSTTFYKLLASGAA